MTSGDPEIIFVASIRLRNGKRIFASQFGLKAFPIRIRRVVPEQLRLPGI